MYLRGCTTKFGVGEIHLLPVSLLVVLRNLQEDGVLTLGTSLFDKTTTPAPENLGSPGMAGAEEAEG